jgi:hypothetical protein
VDKAIQICIYHYFFFAYIHCNCLHNKFYIILVVSMNLLVYSFNVVNIDAIISFIIVSTFFFWTHT